MRLTLIILALISNLTEVYAATSNKTQPDAKVTFMSETREADYTIGDVATQHLIVEVPQGYVLDEGSIPEKGQTEAIELRDIHWQVEDVDAVSRYTFSIHWQIFVAFETVKSTPLRALELVFMKNGKSITVSIPPDSVLVSNLLPPKMDEKHVRPYADVPPQKINLWPLWLGLVSALLVLFMAGFYLAWWMGWITLPSEKNMPLRQAWRQIKQLQEGHEPSVRNALKILGSAISLYAGHTVTVENLSAFCARNPRLQKCASELTRCYQDIQRTFFAGQKPTMRLAEVKNLAKQLSQIEIS